MRWGDILHLTVFPKRRRAPGWLSPDSWEDLSRRYGREMKRLSGTDYRWYVIEFRDGGKELAYLKVRSGGLLTGNSPSICRGIIIPRMMRVSEFHHIKKIRLAF